MPPHAKAVEGDTSSSLLYLTKQPQESSEEHLRKVVTVDDFRPVNIIGRGNMGTVLLVATKASNLPFAMKIAKKDPTREQHLQRTDVEREILSSLHHPFLPRLHALFESDRHSLLLMDFCSGGDLNILRQKQPDKRFSETATLFYAAEVLLALEHVHKLGIVYRDLKPENILIQESGHIMLTDFDLCLRLDVEEVASCNFSPQPGVDFQFERRDPKQWVTPPACFLPCLTENRAKKNAAPQRRGVIIPRDKLTDARSKPASTAFFVGTEEYAAPEILSGYEHGFAVDWWTFGVLLYELIYGATPFKGQNTTETFYNIMEKEPGFPGTRSPIKDLIRRLLVKEPSRRLGFLMGAEEVKRDEFFEGVKWESVEHVCRAPFVPPPFSMAEFEAKANRRRLRSFKAEAVCDEQQHDGVHSGWLGREGGWLQEVFLAGHKYKNQHMISSVVV